MLARWLRRLLLIQGLLFAALIFATGNALDLDMATAAEMFALLFLASNSIVPIVASVIALPPVYGRRGPSVPSLRKLVRSALVEWLVFVALFTLIQPFPNLWLRRQPGKLSGGRRKLVVLVHGYCCNRGLWCWLAPKLTESGLNVATVDLEPPFASIEILANELAIRIEDLVSSRDGAEIVIIAHSMGGLVARAYLHQVKRTPVVKLITIGTPHSGTALAHFGPGRNAREMQRGSPFMKQLPIQAPPSVDTVNIWSWSDTIIAPQDSARLEGVSEYVIPDLGHLSLVFSRRVLQRIISELERTP